MKKTTLLFILLFGFTSFLFAQKSEYISKVNLDSVQKNTTLKFKKLQLKHPFPKDYERMLEMNIAGFEHQKEVFILQYDSNPNIKQRKLDSLKLEYELWRESQVLTLEKAVKVWDKINRRHELNDTYKEKFIDYHFYLGLTNVDNNFEDNVMALSKAEGLVKIAKTIAIKETRYVIAKCSAVKDLDSSAIKYAKKKLYSHLKKKLIAKLEKGKRLTLKRNSDQYCEFAASAVAKKQMKIKAKNKKKQDSIFRLKAKELGIGNEIVENIRILKKKRTDELAERKKKHDKIKGDSDLFENTALKSKSQIKGEFAKGLANLIDLEQFSGLFGSEFIEITDQKVIEKMKLIQDTYKGLSETQLEEVKKMVKHFYYNQEIRTAYYSFDKRLKKQKLSALRYRFEKDYKELMGRYGIEPDVNNKLDKLSFQW